MELLESWLLSMSGSVTGRCILSNILFDLSNNSLPSQVVESFFDCIQDQWKQKGDSETSVSVYYSVVTAFQQFCQSEFSSDCDNLPCSRIMDLRSFVKYNLNTLKAPMTISSRPFSEEQIRDLEELDFRDAGKGYMCTGPKKPFAWVTQSSRLQDLSQMSGDDNVASLVRNCLGLSHYSAVHQLIQINYSSDLSISVMRPTFIEGGTSEYFKSKQRNDGWGETVNFTNCEEGLPEAVHRQVLFGEGFRVTYLGETESTNSYCKDHDLELAFSRGWNVQDVQELLGLILSP